MFDITQEEILISMQLRILPKIYLKKYAHSS